MGLVDQWLVLARLQLGDDPPPFAVPDELPVRVLHPYDGDAFRARSLDQAADICDDGVAFVRTADDLVLDVDDEQCAVGPVLECGHRLSSTSAPRSGSAHWSQ